MGRAVEVAAWVHSVRPSHEGVVWVKCDSDADDPVALVRLVSDAVVSSATHSGLRPAVNQAPRPSASTRHVLALDERLALDDALRASGTDVVVLDDFHHVRRDDVLALLVGLLRRVEHLRLIVCSEGSHPIEVLASGHIDVRVVAPPSEPEEEMIGFLGALLLLLETPWAERLRDDGEQIVRGISAMLRLAPGEGGDTTAGAPRPVGIENSHPAAEFHRLAVTGALERLDELWFDGVAELLGDDAGRLLEALHALPEDALAARPSMRLVRDVLQVALAETDPLNPRNTLRAFADHAARLVGTEWKSLPLNELLVVATGVMTQLRLLGRFEDAAALADRVEARVAASPTEPTSAGRMAWFHLQRGITLLLLADGSGAIRAYEVAWEQATGTSAQWVLANAAADLALTYAMEGDSARAGEWLQRHRSTDSSGWPLRATADVGADLAAGIAALDRLEEHVVQSTLASLTGSADPLELWPYVAFLFAQHALHWGDAIQALTELERMQARYDQPVVARGVAVALLARARADLLIAAGQGERARGVLDRRRQSKHLSGVPRARLRLLSGEGEAGIDPLTWDPATSLRDRLEMLLIGGCAAVRRDDVRNASRLANQALELYRSTGILRPFATVPATERETLLNLADSSLTPADALTVEQHRPVYPDQLAVVRLSRREDAVLKALATARSRQAMADSLFVSVNTVKTQLMRIYQKFGVSNRADALRWAVDHGLLSPEDITV